MSNIPRREAEQPWPNYKNERRVVIGQIVDTLLSTDNWTDFVHDVVLGRIEMRQDEFDQVFQGERVGLYDWTEEQTFPMLRYSQYWDTTTEVWKDLIIDVLVAFRGHPEDLREGKVDQ
jgi:hypothetical protein